MININDKILDQLDEQEMFLALQIARHIGVTGCAWPSLNRLVKLTKWSKTTVLKVRERLYTKRIVQPTSRVDENGRDKATIYRLNTPLIGIFMGSHSIGIVEGTGNVPMGTNGELSRVQEMYPEGTGNVPEVLTNRSINKREESTPAIAAPSIVKFVQSEPDETVEDSAADFVARHSAPRNDFSPFTAAPLPAFQGGTEEDYQSIYSRIADSLNGGNNWVSIASLAKCTMTGAQFKDELQTWIRYYMNKPHLYNKPVQSLRGGPVSFVNWLNKPWAQEKYNKQVKEKQIQEQRRSPVRRQISTLG